MTTTNKNLLPDAIAFDVSDVPTLLKSLRERASMTQSEVAEAMGSEHHGAYQQYENGLSTPSLDQLDKILRAMGWKAGFFALKPPMSPIKLIKAAASYSEVVGTEAKNKVILRKAKP